MQVRLLFATLTAAASSSRCRQAFGRHEQASVIIEHLEEEIGVTKVRDLLSPEPRRNGSVTPPEAAPVRVAIPRLDNPKEAFRRADHAR